MQISINIDIEAAKKALTLCAGSFERAVQIESMTEQEVKDLILKHIRCWGISEVPTNEQ